jgi:transketolase
MVYQAVLAAELLAERGLSAGVVNMHTIKPIDEGLIQQCASETKLMVTVEEHTVFNGLGSAVAEALSQAGSGVRHLKIGLNDAFPTDGPYHEVIDYLGLSGPRIAERVHAFLEEHSIS